MGRASLRAAYACFLVCVTVVVAFAGVPHSAAAAGVPDVAARYAVVVDAKTGDVLYDKGMNTPTAPASLTKLFTALVALDSASPDQVVTVDPSDIVGEASMGLTPGEQVHLRTLIYGMLLPSGNDAAMAAARAAGALPGDTPRESLDRFMARATTLTERLGMRDTHLLNPHGLDQPGHVSTARDIAAITMYGLQNSEFRDIIGTPYFEGDGFAMYHANELLNSYPGLVGGKTGLTAEAGYCLVEVAERDGRTVIAVVLHSTAEDWYRDAETLLDYGFDALASGTAVPGERITLASTGGPQPVSAPPVPVEPVQSPSLDVDRVGQTTAIVSEASSASDSDGVSWRWPVASLGTMLVVFAAVVNLPLVAGMGSRARQFRLPQRSRRARKGAFERGRRNGRRGGARARMVAQPITEPVQSFSAVVDARATAPLGRPDAEVHARRAIGAASRRDFATASATFLHALKSDPTYDLTGCAGFWSLDAAGLLSAARAYAQSDRMVEARHLIRVAREQCGRSHTLEDLLGEVVAPTR